MTAVEPGAVPATVQRAAVTQLPTAHGVFALHGYRAADGTEHVAMVLGDPAAAGRPPLVRVHSECLTGDALGSWRCDCGDQLDAALAAIAADGRGVLVYLRGHEGRGIGLLAKVAAYALQDAGADTVDANTALGLPVDARDHTAGAAVLLDLGVSRVRLMTSNPLKAEALEAAGVAVAEQVGLPVPARAESARYRATKVRRMGHLPVQPLVRQPDDEGPAADDGWDALVGAAHAGPALPPGASGELVERYAPLVAATGPLVVAQVAQSLDGFTAARTGDACFVSGDADREHLHRLRALVDAVVVGVSTVVADDPRLTVRACSGPSPVRVLLDPSARAPRGARLLTEPDAPVLWCTGRSGADRAERHAARHPHVKVVVLPALDGRRTSSGTGSDIDRDIDRDAAVAQLLEALAERGLHRVLVEGGATTVSGFLEAGALDRLWITTAPVLVGDGVPGLRFTGADLMDDALRPPARRFLLGDDVAVELDLAALRAARAERDAAGERISA